MKRKGTSNAELKSIMERDVLGNAGTEFESTKVERNNTNIYSSFFEPGFYSRRLSVRNQQKKK